MLHVALWEPEIPPNTGNVARLCAAVGCPLHLIGRLGFRLDERSLRRAGLDYWDAVTIHRHADLDAFASWHRGAGHTPERCFVFSAHGRRRYTDVRYQSGDCLVFGSESHGLPEETLAQFGDRALTIPMPGGKVRSLNLATAVGIALYEALRQTHGW